MLTTYPFPKLEWLDIDYCDLDHFPFENAKWLGNLKTLTIAAEEGNPLHPDFISNLPNLTTLKIDIYCNVDDVEYELMGELVSVVAGLKQLRRLALHNGSLRSTCDFRHDTVEEVLLTDGVTNIANMTNSFPNAVIRVLEFTEFLNLWE